MQNMQQQQEDVTSRMEGFLKTVLDNLDRIYRNETVDYYKSSLLPQLVAQPRIVLNGQPFGSKTQFQQLWSSLPSTQHQITSYDAHLLPTPGERQYLVLARLKVRFDESGRDRFGQTAEIQPSAAARDDRANYSNWFGAVLNMVVSEKINANYNTECISTFDYRITELPANSVFTI